MVKIFWKKERKRIRKIFKRIYAYVQIVSEAAIQIEGVTKRYGSITALSNVTLNISPGGYLAYWAQMVLESLH